MEQNKNAARETMKKLTYWVSECLNDSKAYSIRAKTRREVMEQLKSYGARAGTYSGDPAWVWGDAGYRSAFSLVHKVTVEYSSAFDLLNQALSEGSICETEQDKNENVR